jgi:FkbM family methyltransferase
VLDVIAKIEAHIDSVASKPDFLDVLFGVQKQAIEDGAKIILFGAGALGKELLYAFRHINIEPVAFCDNSLALHGQKLNGIPVISVTELIENFSDGYVVLSLVKHTDTVVKQLTEIGFNLDRVFRKENSITNKMLAMYAMVGTQALFIDTKNRAMPLSVLDKLRQQRHQIELAYDCYSDQKSKDLFVMKLALLASNLHFTLFNDFMMLFSEPCHEFGLLNYEGTPEDYYYFNNDEFKLKDGEIYLDVGAFDGDSVGTFVDACSDQGVHYKKIIAIEPDPNCYRQLVDNTASFQSMFTHQIGLWNESTTLKFMSSEQAIHTQAGNISMSEDATVTINVQRLDDFLDGDEVTLIKMDPSGDIVLQVLQGAVKTITNHRPKLALGIYHSLDEFIQTPIMLKELCPNYVLTLRHNTYHLCDTDLYANVES